MNEHQWQSTGTVAAPPAEVFAYLDDPAHLAAHMQRRSWAMGGGHMQLLLDAKAGREPGRPSACLAFWWSVPIAWASTWRPNVAARGYIDYASPDRPPARWLGRRYARWCTERMLGEAARHFARSAAAVDLDQVRSTRER